MSRRAMLLTVGGGLLLPAVMSLPVPAEAAAAGTPQAFIQTLGNKTIAILQSSGSRDSRLARLKEILNEAVDLPLVSRLVLGRYWRELSDGQRSDFIDLFRSLSIKTMADGLNNYKGQTFDIASSRKVDDRDTVVSTLIREPGSNQGYHVDWRVRDEGNRFSVVDIVAEGVSLVVTQRNELNSIASRQGVEGLIAEMRRRLQANQPFGQG